MVDLVGSGTYRESGIRFCVRRETHEQMFAMSFDVVGETLVEMMAKQSHCDLIEATDSCLSHSAEEGTTFCDS